VVDFAAHPVQLHHLGEVHHGGCERLQPGGIVLVGADGDEHVDAEVEAVAVEQGDPPVDHAALFEVLDASPARRGRQADALGDLRNGQAGIVLKEGEDFLVDAIHDEGILYSAYKKENNSIRIPNT